MDYVCHLALLFLQDFELILDYFEKSCGKMGSNEGSLLVLSGSYLCSLAYQSYTPS